MNDLFVYEFGFLKRKENGVKRYTLLQETLGKVSIYGLCNLIRAKLKSNTFCFD